MSENQQIEHVPELIKAFHLMWDHLPAPCTLVHKSKTVIAVNPACKMIGREPGMLSSQHGPAESHRGCLADQMINSKQAQVKRENRNGLDLLVFWLPINGYPDYYVHFGFDTSMK